MISGLTEQVWQEVDEFIEAFELAWTADAVPEIKEFLPDTDHPQFRKTLLELVRVDLEFRWKHGCAKSLEEYRREFPELFDDVESLCQIGFEEFRVRRQAGELVAAKEYANRFGIRTDLWPMLSNATEAAASSETLAGPSIVRSVSDRQTNEELLSDATDFPEVGSDMLGFQLQSELGRGAFSRVYLARQGDLANRLVVLKVSAESFAEADKLAQLQHANIVPIYSLHRTRKRTVVCMPYFGSATLADVVRDVHGLDSLPPSGRVIVETLNACGVRTVTDRQQALAQPGTLHSIAVSTSQTHRSESQKSAVSKETRIPYDGALKTLSGLTYVEAVLWIGARLADGLNHAHERGILHRDLKPANVLIADDGRPMLLASTYRQTSSNRQAFAKCWLEGHCRTWLPSRFTLSSSASIVETLVATSFLWASFCLSYWLEQIPFQIGTVP